MKIETFQTLESTNRYCEVLPLTEVEDFSCYWAIEQTAGIGQRGNHWHSTARQDLTFSIVLRPTHLLAAAQFGLTQALSLGLTDTIDSLGLGARTHIKWPNDIYIGSRKVCGILVSNRIYGDAIAVSICGVGLNVNSTTFPDWIPNPTSLALEAGHPLGLETTLHTLLGHIEARYRSLLDGHDMQDEYLSRLLNMGQMATYTYRGEHLQAAIQGVDRFGRLRLHTADGRDLCCAMKEISLEMREVL